jgi:hypothetical protein
MGRTFGPTARPVNDILRRLTVRAWHTYAAMREGLFGDIAVTENRSQPSGSHAGRKPGRLGAAETRLDAALGRLEAALAGAAARAGERDEARARERAEDRAAVARLREENAALQQIRDGVSGRLDAAVERLRRVLAH